MNDLKHFPAQMRADRQVRLIVFDSADAEFFSADGDANLVTQPKTFAAVAESFPDSRNPNASAARQHSPTASGDDRQGALEVILGGALFDAESAERYGLINRALPAELDEFVDTLARRIAALAPGVIEGATAAVDAAAGPDEWSPPGNGPGLAAVTSAVHNRGGRISAQRRHCGGRIGHPSVYAITAGFDSTSGRTGP